ncbi:ubiquitin-protein ligase 7 [Striga asiatica]|uniref:Ubiquitin-protein ligase 7 n=1 Tax=Striga asiatica TaxID=4170 RepID=A0A5A7RF54_STRAF|nr:ubiquitin-protein ligase 7 [Striga asiatica]
MRIGSRIVRWLHTNKTPLRDLGGGGGVPRTITLIPMAAMDKIMPSGIHRKVMRAIKGVGLCTKRPSWNIIGDKSSFLGSGAAQIGQTWPEFPHDLHPLVGPDEHARFPHEARGPARARLLQLSPEHPIRAQILLTKMLHHDPRARGHHALPTERVENAPCVGIHVLRVKPWQNRPGRELDFTDFEAREGDED